MTTDWSALVTEATKQGIWALLALFLGVAYGRLSNQRGDEAKSQLEATRILLDKAQQEKYNDAVNMQRELARLIAEGSAINKAILQQLADLHKQVSTTKAIAKRVLKRGVDV